MISERNMTLAVDMTGAHSVGGWLASEKLNGCRAYWDGRQFWTRGGNVIAAPRWFTRGLPRIHLDGEIHAGRGHGHGNANSAYKVAMTAVRHGGDWFSECDAGQPVRFTAFDAPQAGGNWPARLAIARASWGDVVPVTVIGSGWPWLVPEDAKHFAAFLIDLRKVGAEGAMFRNPRAEGYQAGRSENLLRFKFIRPSARF